MLVRLSGGIGDHAIELAQVGPSKSDDQEAYQENDGGNAEHRETLYSALNW